MTFLLSLPLRFILNLWKWKYHCQYSHHPRNMAKAVFHSLHWKRKQIGLKVANGITFDESFIRSGDYVVALQYTAIVVLLWWIIYDSLAWFSLILLSTTYLFISYKIILHDSHALCIHYFILVNYAFVNIVHEHCMCGNKRLQGKILHRPNWILF